MDTSKEYVEMCEKAEEIQKRDFENGDIIFYKNKWGMYFKEKFYEEMVFNDNTLIKYELNPIWLPRQDQLQEIIGNIGMNRLMSKAYKMFGSLEVSNPKLKEVSMEQLWLAFVMKEKYKKTWNGKDWIK